MPFNIYAILLASLVTLVIGFVWYNPKVFGTIWMIETGITEEKAKKASRAKNFILLFVYSLLLSFFLPTIVIHQMGAIGLIGGPTQINNSLPSYTAFIADYGNAYRTFKHGALHGFLAGVFIILPVVSINSIFEQKSWKYILITAGYWIVSLTIMGGIICAWE